MAYRGTMGELRRVFLSHTSELRQFPVGWSFIDAAEAAVIRVGDAVADMAYFPARDESPAGYCQAAVTDCDVYVGVVGLRYGTLVPDRPEVSHTELEFETATEAGLPRLVFLLDEDAVLPIPASKLTDADPDLRARQRAFREHVMDAGVMVARVASPEQLELEVTHALQESRRTRGASSSRISHQEADVVVSLSPPAGLRDPRLPVRGRDRLLRELSQAAPGVWVVHGLAGSGKTRLAQEAAVRAQDRDADVWWVSAAEAGILAEGMRALGHRLGVSDSALSRGDAADLIWRSLGDRAQPWLLVIDNADDAQLLAGAGSSVAEGRGWLRPLMSGTGLVLVTSRDGRETSWGSWVRLHRLATLSLPDARDVLTDHARHYPSLGSDADATALAARLGCLPLALKLAGSYLAEAAQVPADFADAATVITYRQYQAALGSGILPAVSADQRGLAGDEKSRQVIGRAWDLTLGLLDSRQLPYARSVLRLLASFADAPVPYQLLLRPSVIATSPAFGTITGMVLWQVLRALNDFGLIDLTIPGQIAETPPVVRLHPLVRDASQPSPGSADRLADLDLAAHLINAAMTAEEPGPPHEPRAWPGWQLLAPHAAHLLASVASETGCRQEVLLLAAGGASAAAKYQASQGLYAQAEIGHRDVLAVRLQLLGADHPDTLATRHAIAEATAERGDYPAAGTMYRDLLADQLRILGHDHPDTLSTRHAIAVTTAELGDFTGSQAQFRNLLADQIRVLGPTHPDTLSTRHDLAYDMAERGDYAGAEAQYREVLAETLRVHGPDHPNTFYTRHEIARMTAERGDLANAEAQYRQLLADRLRVLGADHPDTLSTWHAIAETISDRGDHADAEAIYRDLLADRLRVLGPDHRYTQTTRYRIAYEIAQSGDHARAEHMYREVLADQLRVLGPDHRFTLATRHEIARMTAACGDHATAKAQYRDLLADQTRVLGQDHPSTLATLHEIARITAQRGDLADAEAQYRKLLADRIRVVGPHHRLTLATQQEIAQIITQRRYHAENERQ